MGLKHTAVIGAQFGDEGKGKIVDYLAQKHDAVVRFNGGNNAAHSVFYKNRIYKLRMLPAGVFNGKQLLLAQGVVICPVTLNNEINMLTKLGLNIDLLVDSRAHIVMPYHISLDESHEYWRGRNSLSSTKSGIGFCYSDRTNRIGIRIEDIKNLETLDLEIKDNIKLKTLILNDVYKSNVNFNLKNILNEIDKISISKNIIIDDLMLYIMNNKDSKRFLFEGAQGSMLDYSFGTYPYTVAYNTIASSIQASIGISQISIKVVGVLSSYSTRLGNGPFPTEQTNNNGDNLFNLGNEISFFNTKRRCGWLDLNIIRYSNLLNNFESLAVTKLDILSHFNEIYVCDSYNLDGKAIKTFPTRKEDYYKIRPNYKILPGWNSNLRNINRYGDLPDNAKKYLDYIENETGVSIKYISVGPKREQTIEK